MQCNTEYPTPLRDTNLNVMKSLNKKFGTKVGFSDHTLGIDAAVVAATLGAAIIEKHITLSKSMKGPDHKASINEKELKEMIKKIRNINLILGSAEKKITKSEFKNLKIARNSIVAKTGIKKGEKFSKNNLYVKRPGTGISPMEFFRIIGKKAKKNFKIDEQITL